MAIINEQWNFTPKSRSHVTHDISNNSLNNFMQNYFVVWLGRLSLRWGTIKSVLPRTWFYWLVCDKTQNVIQYILAIQRYTLIE